MSKLSYQYDEFIKYKAINEKLPQSLVVYSCSDGSRYCNLDISNYKEIMMEIIKSIKKGDDPNDAVFRNFIKHYINTINQSNYSDFLQKLKALDFNSVKNVQFFCNELITCAIRYPISVKGFTFNEDPKYKYVPEICADVAKYFSSFMTKTEEKNIGFQDELLKICQYFFLDFLNLPKKMDEHNISTSDNYKGFMTFMGLLYSRGIINIKIIIDCIDKIKRNIFCSDSIIDIKMKHGDHSCIKHISKMYGPSIVSQTHVNSICFYDCNQGGAPSETNKLNTKRTHVECINLHKGYDHLISHVINSLRLKINDIVFNYEENTKILIKTEKIITNFKIKHDHVDVIGFVLNKSIRFLLGKEDDRVIKKFDDYLNLFESKTKAYDELYIILESELKNIKDNISNISKSSEALLEYLNIIIKSHQEIINNNQYYKSLNKNSLVTPFKPNVIFTHNSIGQNLNKLCDKFDGIVIDKHITKYVNVEITKIKTTD
jgi:hypothetical protein